MPVYTYRREDGEAIEIQQEFTDPPLTKDPDTGMSVQRIITTSHVVFRGRGFYVTDTPGAKNPAGF